MTANDPAILDRIRLALIEGLSASREIVVNGGLTSLFDASDDMPWINQTVASSPVTPRDLDACVAAYEARQRSPFFEFSPALAPELEPMLLAMDAQLELSAPVMAMRDWSGSRFPGARSATEHDAQWIAEVSALAFGSEPPTPDSIARTREHIISRRFLTAVYEIDGLVVSSGAAFGSSSIHEVAGIATHPDFRRRGAAKAVIDELLRQFFATGGEIAWLTPGGDDAKTLYETLGFQTIGTQVAYRL